MKLSFNPLQTLLILFLVKLNSQCTSTCDALASYYMWDGTNVTFISTMFATNINQILTQNLQLTNPDFIRAGHRLNVRFSCGCINDQFMGHQFSYQVRLGDFYRRISERYYANLTNVDMMRRFNSYGDSNIPDNASLNVVVNCSCGNRRVSRDYGLFVTYPLRSGDSLTRLANEIVSESLLREYNPGVDFASGSGLVFIPGRDQNGTFPPLRSSSSGVTLYRPCKMYHLTTSDLFGL